MKYHELQTRKVKASTRVGRGIAAGQGKTAGRGTKGQKARTGAKRRPGFEGGQNPLMQRLPKLGGFRSTRTRPENVYTSQLDQFSPAVNNLKLAEAGLVTSQFVQVKLIVKGGVTKKLSVELQAASASAIKAIEKAGGSFTKTPQVKRLKQKTANKKQ